MPMPCREPSLLEPVRPIDAARRRPATEPARPPSVSERNETATFRIRTRLHAWGCVNKQEGTKQKYSRGRQHMLYTCRRSKSCRQKQTQRLVKAKPNSITIRTKNKTDGHGHGHGHASPAELIPIPSCAPAAACPHYVPRRPSTNQPSQPRRRRLRDRDEARSQAQAQRDTTVTHPAQHTHTHTLMANQLSLLCSWPPCDCVVSH